jgi:hypothetical protein
MAPSGKPVKGANGGAVLQEFLGVERHHTAVEECNVSPAQMFRSSPPGDDLERLLIGPCEEHMHAGRARLCPDQSQRKRPTLT